MRVVQRVNRLHDIRSNVGCIVHLGGGGGADLFLFVSSNLASGDNSS